MTRRILFAFLLAATAGAPIPDARSDEKPRLVVLISIDQLPYGYLDRFMPYFGEGGFRLLMDQGAVFANGRYDYASTFTGPGHATIGTGTYPYQHGIVGNNWYDQREERNTYCVQDTGTQRIGGPGEGRSPRLLKVTTVGDELRSATGGASRVFSVSQKDRSAILMGGHRCNGAYWLADSLFVTSSWYTNQLPSWANEFNRSGLATSFFGRLWKKSLPEEAYAGMDADDAPYEGDVAGMGRRFPHRITGNDTSAITGSYFSALWNSPYLNDLMMAFVLKMMEAESIGQGDATDLLCIGLSANDAVGHTFGPESQEVLEMMVQTDHLLAAFFHRLDETIELGRCVIALTSDHGVAPIPESVTDRRAGRADRSVISALCERFLDRRYGHPDISHPWIARVVDSNIYLDRPALRQKHLDPDSVAAILADSLRTSDLIAAVLTSSMAVDHLTDPGIPGKLARSFDPSRSGDLSYALPPYFIDYAGPGTDHGQPYEYDTHVPVILFGPGIKSGLFDSTASPADIAPTLASVLGIAWPDGRAGRVLKEALR